MIAKYQRRFPDFNDRIISTCARGMSVREIGGHLEEIYGIDVSPDLISAVTDAVLDEIAEWQNRPLDVSYPLVFFDALRVKIRDEGFVRNKAVYIALGVLPDGTKDILGLWIEQTEGAKFWLRVMNELKGCGVSDILIAVVDGLRGFPEAINAVFPQTVVQTCIAISSVIRWILSPGKTASSSLRCSRPSTALSMPMPARRRSTPLQKDLGAQNIQPSPRAGVVTGISSSRFLRFPKRSLSLSVEHLIQCLEESGGHRAGVLGD